MRRPTRSGWSAATSWTIHPPMDQPPSVDLLEAERVHEADDDGGFVVDGVGEVRGLFAAAVAERDRACRRGSRLWPDTARGSRQSSARPPRPWTSTTTGPLAGPSAR